MDINTNTPKVNKNDLLTAVLNKLKLQFGTVEVGFFKGTHTYPNGKDVTEVAKKNNEGIKVPKREFMIPAANKASNKAIRITGVGIASGFDENLALQRAAEVFQGAIQKEITNLKEPPNSPYTIAKKGSSNPLIDSGDMRKSVKWKLRPPK